MGNRESQYEKIRGENHYKWNGGRTNDHGYPMITVAGHPRATKDGYVRESIVIAEQVLGKYLPKGAQVHHVDGNIQNNATNNLVICQDAAYHRIIHRRMTALKECGHANWLKCPHCKEYDDPSTMYKHPTTLCRAEHRECMNKNARDRRKNKELRTRENENE